MDPIGPAGPDNDRWALDHEALIKSLIEATYRK